MISLDQLTVTLVTPRHAYTLPALLVLVAQSHMHHTSMLQSPSRRIASCARPRALPRQLRSARISGSHTYHNRAPHRPTGKPCCTKSRLLTISRIPHPTHNLAHTPSDRTKLIEASYELVGLKSNDTTATSTALPIMYTRTPDTTTRTAAPAPTTPLPSLQPAMNDTQGETQHAKPVGPIAL
jgi:hypothetical protein